MHFILHPLYFCILTVITIMYLYGNNVLPLLRKLFLMYKDYYGETKEKLAEIENHMNVISNEAMKPI